MSVLLRWASALGLLCLVGCQTQNLLVEKNEQRNVSDFAYQADYQYTIRKDDKIEISVWGEENLSVGSVYGIYNSNEVYGKWLMVDAEGHIEVPKIGTMTVVGLTLPQLKSQLREQLKKWLLNPVVDVKVLNKEITVLGEVRNPSVIHVDKDYNSLLEIIAKTGGFDFYANLKSIKVLRQEGQDVRVTNIDLTAMGQVYNQNIQLHPGDCIIVPSRKSKHFDKRVSAVIPFATVATAAAILFKTF